MVKPAGSPPNEGAGAARVTRLRSRWQGAESAAPQNVDAPAAVNRKRKNSNNQRRTVEMAKPAGSPPNEGAGVAHDTRLRSRRQGRESAAHQNEYAGAARDTGQKARQQEAESAAPQNVDAGVARDTRQTARPQAAEAAAAPYEPAGAASYNQRRALLYLADPPAPPNEVFYWLQRAAWQEYFDEALDNFINYHIEEENADEETVAFIREACTGVYQVMRLRDHCVDALNRRKHQ